MRICVFGAGAIGGNFAARLADAGNEVSVVARGQHLEAIKANGLTLIAGDRKIVAKVHASDRPADLGPQDVVISTLKATGLDALAASVGPLLGPETRGGVRAERHPVVVRAWSRHVATTGARSVAPRSGRRARQGGGP